MKYHTENYILFSTLIGRLLREGCQGKRRDERKEKGKGRREGRERGGEEEKEEG